MILSTETRVAHKTISCLLAGIFLFQQVAWAGDLIDNVLTRQSDSQAQTFAPAYLQDQQAISESIVEQHQYIEDLSVASQAVTTTSADNPQQATDDPSLPLMGPRGGVSAPGCDTAAASGQGAAQADGLNSSVLNVTTSAGDIISYRNGGIDSIQKKDGTILRNIVVGENNGLLSAEIFYADGTIQVVLGGKVTRMAGPDGTLFSYNGDEKISSILYADGKAVSFSYGVADADGDIVTVLTDTEKSSYYDSDNRLKRVKFSTGKVIEYSGGVISKITEADMGRYIFDIRTDAAGTFTSDLARYEAPDGAIYRYSVNENGALSSVSVEKNGAVAAYNKEGVLVEVVKDGQALTAGDISDAQSEYDAAVASYEQIKQEAETYRLTLDSATSVLTNMSIERDRAQAALNAAIQSLADAESDKYAKQASCDIACNDYLIARSSYESADRSLSIARTSEVQAGQDLAGAQNALAAKQATLNSKIAATQALQSDITGLSNKIQADQANLTQSQAVLNQAITDESAAQTDFNNAQADVNAKQTAYAAAVQARQVKETALNVAIANLAAAQQAKALAENALSNSSYAVSSYAYATDSTVLNQCENMINDNFNSYNSAVWYKPADTLVAIGGGSATLKGTGKNYNATFYANQSYNRSDEPVLSTSFTVNSTSGQFIAALDNSASSAYRRVGVCVQNGNIYLQAVSGNSTINAAVLVSGVKANTRYNIEFAVTAGYINVYLWAAAGQKPVTASYNYAVSDWAAVRPYFSLYSGTATVNPVTMKSPSHSSTYDTNSQLIKDAYQDGNYSTYLYSTKKITITDYYLANGSKTVASQTRTVNQGSAEWNQILARNQLVKNLNTAIVNINTAQASCNTANTALNNARTAESLAQQNLASAQNTLAAKQAILNSKLAFRQAIQATIINFNNEITSYQALLKQANMSLTGAMADQASAQAGYDSALADVNVRQSSYNTAVQDRQDAEAAFVAAGEALSAKSALKDRANSALQTAGQDLSTARSAKDAGQAVYDSVCAAYLSAGTAYDKALGDYNDSQARADAAKATADELHGALNALLSVYSIFPREDAVLQSANDEIEAISIVYNAQRRVKEIRNVNGDKQADADGDGLIDNITTVTGTTLYSYDLSALRNIKETTVDRDGLKRIYDQYGDLKSLSLSDATKIVYENGQVKEIQKADGTTIKNMTFRDSGELDSALVSYPDGSLAVYEDARLLETISSSGDITDYGDGKIRKIRLGDGAEYVWSYDADGNIAILDGSKGQERTYREGKLIELKELSGAKLLTKYYYDAASGDLSRSEVCQSGDVLYAYSYTYASGLTLVHDEDGNTQAYTKDKKLSYIIDLMGRKYSYTYVGKAEGHIEVYFPSAVKARYDSAGSLIDITEPNGGEIKDITLGAGNTPKDFTYIKDGVTYKVSDGTIEEVIAKDGTDTRYYDNGYMQSVKSALGELTEYQYYVKDSISLSGVTTILSGAGNNLSLYEQDSAAHLTLSDTPFKYGTGVDGAKRVTADETLTAGTYNFSSLVVDAGKALKVAPGTVINVLGAASISGALFCGGSFNINAYEVNVASGASITGAVNIKCHTINNSGLITGNAAMTGTGSGRYGNAVDDNFATGVSNSVWGMSDTVSVSFPSCDIQSAIYRSWLGSYGLPAYADVYLCVNGTWVSIAGYSGSGDSGIVNNTAGWHNVTGMMMTGRSLNGNCVSSAYNLYEMQAIIGTPTIEYASGNPGVVNSSASRPTATKAQAAAPASGSFVSNVMEFDALTLDSLSWSQSAPRGTAITFQTRSGDMATPDTSWSEWSAPMTDPDGSAILSPGKRYIQYKATFSTTDPAASPVLDLAFGNPITISYERAPAGAAELSEVDRATVSHGGAVTSYDKNSWVSVITDPVFDAHLIDSVKRDITKYILNDTQKEVYLRDSVIVSELTAIKSVDGTVTEYCQGQISRITRPDGTIITDIDFDADNNAKDYTCYKGGNAYEVRGGAIDTVITAAGEKIQYYSYGLVGKRVVGESVTEYEYGSTMSKSLAASDVVGSGKPDKVSLLEKDGVRYLTLSDASFKYGTGVDGVKRVTSDETLAAGEYSFSSLIVDAGKTLKVAPGAVINVLGAVSISGAVFCGGSFNINAYEVNVASGASITGAVNIKCNTINNSGLITGNAAMTGAPSGGANEADRDDNFSADSHSFAYNVSGSGSTTSIITFPTGHISYIRASASGNGNAGHGEANFYVRVNGSWQYTGAGGAGTGNPGWSFNISGATRYDNGGAGWDNVDAIMAVVSAYSSGGVARAYMQEMQAIIGTPTIEYTGGNPGVVNTSASRPTATQAQAVTPASGSFESGVMELNALKLGSVAWKENLPPGTNITIHTRTGSTVTPDDTWSDWSTPMTDPSGSGITSSGNKYFQYRVNMTSSDASQSPSLIVSGASDVSVSYTAISYNPDDAYVKVRSGGITKTYNKHGVNIADPADTIDAASLKFDPAYQDALKENIPYYKLSDAQKVITLYDQGSDTPVEIVTAGQSITYFDSGLATKVVDKDGTTQVVYTYDSDKNVISVEFTDARAKLADSYNKALADIVTQREQALVRIDRSEADNLASIASQSASAQVQISSERQRLSLQMSAYDPAIYDLSAFTSAFAELDSYQARVIRQTQDAYKELAIQVADARARIEADSNTAMAGLIANDYNKILGDIVQKESSPIIYQYYRKVLGRDPGDSDLLYWMNKAKSDLKTVTAAGITEYLQSLPEYALRQSRKQNIITHLTTFLTQYLVASPTEKESMLTSIGLTASDAVTLTQSDVDSILSWLSGQSLHFGDSAIESIVSMLKSSGINKSFEGVGEAALKVDILTGVITKSTTGDLLLSMFAMRKAAESSGLNLASQKIDYSGLKAGVAQGGLITHIDGKHFVIVTSVDDAAGTVTYTDSTIGQSGQAITITKAEFMETWKGFALSKELAPVESKQLNVTQEKNIRGSGWWSSFWKGIVGFFQKIVAPIGALLLFTPLAPVGAVLLGINIVIQTISFVVHTGTLMDIAWSAVTAVGSAIGSMVLPGIFEGARNLFSSIGSMMPVAVKDAFTTCIGIFNPITTAVKGISTGIANIFNPIISESVAELITTNIISTGVNMGSDLMFKCMGLDSSLSSMGSALFTGAISGIITPGADVASIVSSALKYGTIEGANELGKAVNLDPNITHLAGMMAGSLVNGAFTTSAGNVLSYAEIMKDIAPNIIREAARVGVLEIGNLLGVDNRISYLTSAVISSGIDTGYGSDGVFDWKDSWAGIQEGLMQGVASISINYTTQEFGLNPIFANIGFSAISGAINTGIQLATGTNQDVLKDIFKTYKDNALTFLGYGDPSNAWQQAAYISQILDFSDIVKHKGLIYALNAYGAGFFNATAVNAITKTGLSIGEYFANKLSSGQYALETRDGKEFKSVEITDKYGNSIGMSGLFEDINLPDGSKVSNLIGRRESLSDGLFFGLGDIGIDAYGKVAFKNAVIETIYDDIRKSQKIESGKQTYADVYDIGSGRALVTITPSSQGGYNIYSEDGSYFAAKIKSDNGNSIIYYDGKAEEYTGTTMFRTSEELLNSFMLYASQSTSNSSRVTVKQTEKGSDVSVNLSNISAAEKQEIIDYYLVMNGIGNKDYYNSPGYIYNFSDKLNAVSPGRDDIALIPMFNDKMPKIDSDSLEDVVGYQKELLFNNLIQSGYIEADGTLKREFYDLSGPANMLLYTEFNEKRQLIYDFLVGLSKAYFDYINDIARNVSDWCGQTTYISNQIYRKMLETYKGNWPSYITGLCYSGSGDPFIYMINTHPEIDVSSIVLVGTPMKGDRWIYNTNVNTVVTMYGEKDDIFLASNTLLRKDFLPSKSRLFEKNPRQVNEVVIRLNGIGHNGYFYDPKNPGSNPALQQKAAEFIARVTAKAKDPVVLEDFLLRRTGGGVTRDSASGKYIVDLEGVVYDS